jgi:hypothetical protein
VTRFANTAATALIWIVAALGWIAFWWIVSAFLWWIFFQLK